MAARIDKIVASIHVPEFDDELWENTSLRQMYQHAGLFLPGIEGYLRANPTAPQLNVHVALLALQCLPIDHYLEFTARLAKAEKGAVGEWALFFSVVPGFEWSARLGVAYKDPKVRAVLKRSLLRRTPINVFDQRSRGSSAETSRVPLEETRATT